MIDPALIIILSLKATDVVAKIVDGVTWVCGGRTPEDYLNDCFTYNEVLNSWNVASGRCVVLYRVNHCVMYFVHSNFIILLVAQLFLASDS